MELVTRNAQAIAFALFGAGGLLYGALLVWWTFAGRASTNAVALGVGISLVYQVVFSFVVLTDLDRLKRQV